MSTSQRLATLHYMRKLARSIKWAHISDCNTVLETDLVSLLTIMGDDINITDAEIKENNLLLNITREETEY